MISIAHSRGEAAALASETERLGLDVERIDESILDAAGGFCGARERDIMARALGDTEAEILARLWTIKDSALKTVGTGITLKDLSVAKAALKGGYLVAAVDAPNGTSFRTVSWLRGGYAFAAARLRKRNRGER